MPNITDRATELAKSVALDPAPESAQGAVNTWAVDGDVGAGQVTGHYHRAFRRVTVGVYAGAVLKGAKRAYAGFTLRGSW